MEQVTEQHCAVIDPAFTRWVREAEHLASAAERRVREQRARIAALERTGGASRSAVVLLRAFEESFRAHTQALGDLRAGLGPA